MAARAPLATPMPPVGQGSAMAMEMSMGGGGGWGRFAKVLEECAAADAAGVVVPAATARMAALAALAPPTPALAPAPAPAPARRGGLREALQFSKLDQVQPPNKYALAARAKIAGRQATGGPQNSPSPAPHMVSPPRESVPPRPPTSPISMGSDTIEGALEEGSLDSS